MLKSLMPVILVVIAVAIFFGFVTGEYDTTKQLTANRSEFVSALGQYDTLVSLRDRLQAQKDAFAKNDLEQLQKIVPDNVDNIRLFLDMQGIAARHHMAISNIRVGDSPTASTQSELSSIGPSDSTTGTITLSFSTLASYDNLIGFLEDVQRSLRIVEIKSLDFRVGAKPDSYQVSIGINTYWLKGTNAIVINK